MSEEVKLMNPEDEPLELIPVGVDWDGFWKSINEMSYAPSSLGERLQDWFLDYLGFPEPPRENK